jgi:DNA repair exonuclease SbcCD ATPase subunit
MRTFYEEKLNLMESELKEKEVEREELLQQLESAKTRGSAKGLQERLKEKDDHIASLREKQKELKNLTRVSSRNESEISRLQNDVTDMKRKRVGLQKELTSERKRHLDDVKQLQKLTSQKEREINKLQKLSNQREVQAKKAGQVAKARLDEINMLRAKNKESEKRLRMQSVKKGLMEKAGIDSVLVGQRPKRTGKTTRRPPKSTGVDADALRALFDQKIAEVVRKETLADKLAEEWEEHYELTSRKQDLMTSSDSEAADDILSLSVNIKYKQDRIRQLAQRLGKPDHKDSRKGIGDKTHFELFDEQFEKLCRGTSVAED